jgi:hypothetical protein
MNLQKLGGDTDGIDGVAALDRHGIILSLEPANRSQEENP